MDLAKLLFFVICSMFVATVVAAHSGAPMTANNRDRIIHPDDQRHAAYVRAKTWGELIAAQAQRACTPLSFARAQGDTDPVPLEVVRNGEGCVLVHCFRRPDLTAAVIEPVVAAALAEVFGAPLASMPRNAQGELENVFYRDERAISERTGVPPLLPADSFYVEFPAGVSSLMADAPTLRDRMALNVKKFWSTIGPG